MHPWFHLKTRKFQAQILTAAFLGGSFSLYTCGVLPSFPSTVPKTHLLDKPLILNLPLKCERVGCVFQCAVYSISGPLTAGKGHSSPQL